MSTLKYTVIENEEQYFEYCNMLETLVCNSDNGSNNDIENEIKLLNLLIEKWDEENHQNLDPVQLLQSLMAENKIKQKELAEIMGVVKSVVSDILNYKRGLSKDNIRKLATHFKISQEALNRPDPLKSPLNLM